VNCSTGILRATLVAICGLVLLLGVVPRSLAHSRQARTIAVKCPPVHSHLILANAHAEVYTALDSLGLDYVSACAYGHRSYRLGPVESCIGGGSSGGLPCEGVRQETLAGSVLAYERFSGGNIFEWVVVVRDLRTGRLLHRAPSGTPPVPKPGSVGSGPTTAIVVKSGGSVAWIVEPEVFPRHYEVRALDSSGERLLASAADIDPHSLALASGTLYWTQGGRPFSAQLS
jgi:hypothetical protein